jgi:hypothetical protein
LKDNKMLAAVLIIVIVLAVAFIVWRVMAGKKGPVVDEKGVDLLAPLELKPGEEGAPPPTPNQPVAPGGG